MSEDDQSSNDGLLDGFVDVSSDQSSPIPQEGGDNGDDAEEG